VRQVRLKTFLATKLNHIEHLKIDFSRDVTFLTGVNGSGKTSVLRAINALLNPNLEALAMLNFEEISISFEISSKVYTLVAQKDNRKITISASHLKSQYTYEAFEDELYSNEDPETRRTYYRELMLVGSKERPVLNFLSNVPTPMYLGLDRRHSSQLKRLRWRAVEPRRRKRNIFFSPLSDSLNQAVALAENAFSEVRFKTSRFDAEFNRDLLLSLLEIPETDPFGLDPPTIKDRELIETTREALRQLPGVAGVSADDIRARLNPALANIDEIVKQIPKNFDFDKVESDENNSRTAFTALLQWARLKPTLSQITKVAELATLYNSKVSEVNKEIAEYSGLIDNFYDQTGKTLGFDSSGRVSVQKGAESFGIEELSSGEAQIFVILTHLAFNPYASEAGVFIIDEPELSLHLFWQDMLVESMLKANPNIQYLMATHSPAIIGTRVDKALDMSVQ
jgi:predicted ATP-binding protein involved in virulence